jgi:hypothetical protein
MYRQTDLEFIKKNLDYIKDEALKKRQDIIEPTISEYKNVYKAILEFIKKTKRIVYGGYAQNHLIKMKNSNDVFYKETDIADIEFYSYEPLKDIVELADFLHSKGFKYVEGKGGVHEETYKIFVNFENYVDVSYMPKNVYDNLPTIEDDGIKYSHPHLMLIDAFRVYADPLTSYWRLDKTFNRFATLIKHYPFDTNFEKYKIMYDINISQDELKKVKHFIRHKVLHGSQLIVIGNYAFNYLVKKVNKNLEFENCPYYQAVSINYKEDKDSIEKFLKKEYNNKITVKHFTPFFQFYDFHTEYYYNNICILKIYGHNNRCIVNNFSERKKVFFGTFQLVFLYLLIDYQYAITNRNDREKNNYMSMITRLLKAREYYLDTHNITILDKSPFQEFTLQCLGSTEDPMRMARLEGLRKREAGKQSTFNYKPKGNPGKVPVYRFDNTSGNEILNK